MLCTMTTPHMNVTDSQTGRQMHLLWHRESQPNSENQHNKWSRQQSNDICTVTTRHQPMLLCQWQHHVTVGMKNDTAGINWKTACKEEIRMNLWIWCFCLHAVPHNLQSNRVNYTDPFSHHIFRHLLSWQTWRTSTTPTSRTNNNRQVHHLSKHNNSCYIQQGLWTSTDHYWYQHAIQQVLDPQQCINF